MADQGSGVSAFIRPKMPEPKGLTLEDLKRAFSIQQQYFSKDLTKGNVIIVSPNQHKQILAMESKGRMVVAGTLAEYTQWLDAQMRARTVTKGSKVGYCDSVERLLGIRLEDWEIVLYGTYETRPDWDAIHMRLIQDGFRPPLNSHTNKEGKRYAKRFKVR